MYHLLKLEFHRLFRSKTFYICLAASLFMVFVSVLTNKLLFAAIDTDELGEAFGMAFEAPTALSTFKGFGTAYLSMILAVFITLFVTEDYSSNTIKNIYAKGYSRDLVFFAKFLSSLAASLIFIVASAILSLILGKAFFGEFGEAGHFFAGSVVATFFVLIAYHTVFFFIAICMRKLGGALSISLVGPTALGLILSLISAATSSKVDLTQYWLDGCLTKLAAFDVSGNVLATAFIMGFCMIAGGLAIGFFANRTKDQ